VQHLREFLDQTSDSSGRRSLDVIHSLTFAHRHSFRKMEKGRASAGTRAGPRANFQRSCKVARSERNAENVTGEGPVGPATETGEHPGQRHGPLVACAALRSLWGTWPGARNPGRSASVAGADGTSGGPRANDSLLALWFGQ